MKKTLKQELTHKWLLLIATTVLLAACGGHSSYKTPDPVCVAPQVLKAGVCVTETPVTMVDAFTKYVGDLLTSLFDDKEPIAITDVALTAPDNTEPEVVK